MELSPEKNYCVTQRELLTVVKGVKYFPPYLYGQHFDLRTDHASLMWLCRRKEPADQVVRWLETLAEFGIPSTIEPDSSMVMRTIEQEALRRLQTMQVH